MASHPAERRPIFILGLMQRTGTVFLGDLLTLHPECALPAPIWEDFLLAQADPLIRYADELAERWRTTLKLAPDQIHDPLPALGAGLISMLAGSVEGKRLVTKTPSVRNLESFFRLFPGAYLVILVRDGRAAVESAVRSWDMSYAEMMRRWAGAARKVLECEEAWRGVRENYLIVRYEDLVSDLERELRRVFERCNIDPRAYDFEAAANLPLRGSSRYLGPAGRPHWQPVWRPPDFDPQALWRSWSVALQQEFQLVAGDVSSRLGYETEPVPRRALRARVRRVLNDRSWRLPGGRWAPHGRRRAPRARPG